MYVLDTNVVSELMRPMPDPSVETWVAGHRAAHLHFSSIGEAEIRFGVAIMPAGRRREALAAAIDGLMCEDFSGRVLPFDSAAARAYAEIAAARRSVGRPVSQADCQIAAIARAHGLALATRNVRDFAGMGIEITDPWVSA